jgi:hypothetical protein
MVKYLIIGTMLFVTFALYACCVVGGDADKRSERWFYGRSDKSRKGD